MIVTCKSRVLRIGETRLRQLASLALEAADDSSADGHALLASIVRDLRDVIDAAADEECGWAGYVSNVKAWLCPSCLTEHILSGTFSAESVLTSVETALIETIKRLDDPRPRTVIPAVIRDYPRHDVVSAYWRLRDHNIVRRAPDGRLSVASLPAE